MADTQVIRGNVRIEFKQDMAELMRQDDAFKAFWGVQDDAEIMDDLECMFVIDYLTNRVELLLGSAHKGTGVYMGQEGS